MVVFTCNHCGDTLHKPKVEKHYQFACRNSKALTCVDCLKDFRGDEYNSHTKCVTEDERYAAKGTFVNGNVKKGEIKQESWIEMIGSILSRNVDLQPNHRNLLKTISGYSNVPRKKQKFLNFIKSSSGNRVNLKDAEEVWDIIEKYKIQNAQQKTTESKQSETCANEKENKNEENEKKRKAGEDNEGSTEKKKRKQSLESVTGSNENDEPQFSNKHKKNVVIENNLSCTNPVESLSRVSEEQEVERFSFKDKILEIVRKKKHISLKKLEKRVLNSYLKATGASEVSPHTVKKYNKKLKKVPNLEINDDTVTLVEN